jgi:hypothetical protein
LVSDAFGGQRPAAVFNGRAVAGSVYYPHLQELFADSELW